MDIAILGAGCSGSSLAYFLTDSGFTGRIHVFDLRTDFSREQHWCSWGPVPGSLSGLIDASWERWMVVSANRRVVCSLPERPYVHVQAAAFFEAIHSKLRKHLNVSLHLGSNVRHVARSGLGGESRRVVTDTGCYDVDVVFDSRFPQPNAGTARVAGHSEGRSETNDTNDINLVQSFAGLVVESSEDVFDPGVATLMDFGAGGSQELSFVYVLPFSARRALVESTVFAAKTVDQGEHERRVENYLEHISVGSYRVECRETGCIPMTTARFPRMRDERHVMIGAAGGANRPSSGYAFVTILRQSQDLAEALMRGEYAVRRTLPRKYGFLDEIFLDVLTNSPGLARESFVSMFENVPTASLVRFLSNESTLRDDLAIVRSLAKIPFLAASVRRMVASLPRVLGPG